MSHNKVYSLCKVPFSWENAPGICKEAFPKVVEGHEDTLKLQPPPCPTRIHEVLGPPCLFQPPAKNVTKKGPLPPPPCRTESHKVFRQETQIPLPPCPFQPPLKSAAKKGLAGEDPFLAAYMECTKSFTEGTFSKVRSKKSMGHWEGKRLSKFSCKRSCGVREDGLVRMVHPSTTGELSRPTSLGSRTHC